MRHVIGGECQYASCDVKMFLEFLVNLETTCERSREFKLQQVLRFY